MAAMGRELAQALLVALPGAGTSASGHKRDIDQHLDAGPPRRDVGFN